MIVSKPSTTPIIYHGLSTDNKDVLFETLSIMNCGSEFYCVDTGDIYILNTTPDNSTQLKWYRQVSKRVSIF